jgi:hypothetical protein
MSSVPKVPHALPRILREETPKRAGMSESVTHVAGFGPRRQKRISAASGTNPAHPVSELGGLNLKRRPGGMTQYTAPYKHTSEGISSGVMGPGEGEPV